MPATLRELADAHIGYAEGRLKTATATEIRRLWRRVLLPLMGEDDPLDAVTARDFEAVHRAMRSTPVQGNRALACARSGWEVGRLLELHDLPNPLQNWRKRWAWRESPRTAVVPSQALSTLLEELDRMWKSRGIYQRRRSLLLLTLCLTGARRGEITPLTWADVDLEVGSLRIRDSKTGPKEILLPEILRERFAELKDAPRSERAREYEQQRVFWGANIRKTWRDLRPTVGAHFATMHDLRRTLGSRLRDEDVPIEQIAAQLGNTRAVAIRHYAHLGTAAKERLAERSAAAVLDARRTAHA